MRLRLEVVPTMNPFIVKDSEWQWGRRRRRRLSTLNTHPIQLVSVRPDVFNGQRDKTKEAYDVAIVRVVGLRLRRRNVNCIAPS